MPRMVRDPSGSQTEKKTSAPWEGLLDYLLDLKDWPAFEVHHTEAQAASEADSYRGRLVTPQREVGVLAERAGPRDGTLQRGARAREPFEAVLPRCARGLGKLMVEIETECLGEELAGLHINDRPDFHAPLDKQRFRALVELRLSGTPLESTDQRWLSRQLEAMNPATPVQHRVAHLPGRELLPIGEPAHRCATSGAVGSSVLAPVDEGHPRLGLVASVELGDVYLVALDQPPIRGRRPAAEPLDMREPFSYQSELGDSKRR